MARISAHWMMLSSESNWSDSSDWDIGSAPTVSDDVHLRGSSPYQVDITGAADALGTHTIDVNDVGGILAIADITLRNNILSTDAPLGATAGNTLILKGALADSLGLSKIVHELQHRPRHFGGQRDLQHFVASGIERHGRCGHCGATDGPLSRFSGRRIGH